METEIIKELSELKTEMKYIWKTLVKVEKVLENQLVFEEKQNVANKRILSLESTNDKIYVRLRKLEDWKIQSITLATLIATIFGFILNKLF